MIFRQLFDNVSSTYTYLLAGRSGGEALIIDPVFERVDRYCQLLEELDLKLLKVVDTHVHADHVTGMAELRDRTKCVTVMGKKAPVDVVSMRVQEGDTIDIDGVSMGVLYTPGHTSCSYSFVMKDRVFTGDTLLIRGTGRTDFQSGNAHEQYDSLFNKLLKLPDDTLVYPAHDYKGDTVSSIGEEKAFNPRLQVASAEEYAEIMDNLNLDNPKMMDIAVPANMKVGIGQGLKRDADWALNAEEVMKCAGKSDCLLIDLREDAERQKNGVIPGSVHAPYTRLDVHIKPGGLLREAAGDKRLIFYCAFGERSALAIDTAQALGLENVCHLAGGIDAWKQAGGDIATAA